MTGGKIFSLWEIRTIRNLYITQWFQPIILAHAVQQQLVIRKDYVPLLNTKKSGVWHTGSKYCKNQLKLNYMNSMALHQKVNWFLDSIVSFSMVWRIELIEGARTPITGPKPFCGTEKCTYKKEFLDKETETNFLTRYSGHFYLKLNLLKIGLSDTGKYVLCEKSYFPSSSTGEESGGVEAVPDIGSCQISRTAWREC